jgi:RimJ/RimL family protein N-acetyltransferase
MRFRRATEDDVPQICALESKPEFRTMVAQSPAEEHLGMLAEPGTVYLVAESEPGTIAACALLRGLDSPHKSVELKRLVVGVPNQGLGRKLLTEVAKLAFGEVGAHRLYLDVFVTNDRARHVYESFGFRKEGMMRDAIYRDGAFHSLVLMSLLEDEWNRKNSGSVD